MNVPETNWIENDPKKYNSFSDGSAFLIAVNVTNTKSGQTNWEFDCVEFDCDGDGANLVYRGSREPFDSWSWDDIEFFHLLEGDMPTYHPINDPDEND